MQSGNIPAAVRLLNPNLTAIMASNKALIDLQIKACSS